MTLINLILNLAGLLLWLNWRAEKADPVDKRRPATLLGTLRRVDQARHWHLPAFIAALILLRALFYWQVGSTARWSTGLDCGTIALHFPVPADTFLSLGYMVLFSIFSFALTLAVFFLCLLLLSILDGPEPFRIFVRQQLGAMDGWRRETKLLAPFVAGTVLWWTLSWLFAWLQIIPFPASEPRRLGQALAVGMGSYLAWKFVALTLLGLHLLNSYIYFGKHPFWDFVNAEARALLAPLRKLPLRAGKIDLSPLAGIVGVFLAAEGLAWGLEWLYRRWS